MEKLFGNINNTFCRNLNEDLKKLELVFSKSGDRGLKVLRKKYTFLQEPVKYLAHVISDNSLIKSKENVVAILYAPLPKGKLRNVIYL